MAADTWTPSWPAKWPKKLAELSSTQVLLYCTCGGERSTVIRAAKFRQVIVTHVTMPKFVRIDQSLLRMMSSRQNVKHDLI